MDPKAREAIVTGLGSAANPAADDAVGRALDELDALLRRAELNPSDPVWTDAAAIVNGLLQARFTSGPRMADRVGLALERFAAAAGEALRGAAAAGKPAPSLPLLRALAALFDKGTHFHTAFGDSFTEPAPETVAEEAWRPGLGVGSDVLYWYERLRLWVPARVSSVNATTHMLGLSFPPDVPRPPIDSVWVYPSDPAIQHPSPTRDAPVAAPEATPAWREGLTLGARIDGFEFLWSVATIQDVRYAGGETARALANTYGLVYPYTVPTRVTNSAGMNADNGNGTTNNAWNASAGGLDDDATSIQGAAGLVGAGMFDEGDKVYGPAPRASAHDAVTTTDSGLTIINHRSAASAASSASMSSLATPRTARPHDSDFDDLRPNAAPALDNSVLVVRPDGAAVAVGPGAAASSSSHVGAGAGATSRHPASLDEEAEALARFDAMVETENNGAAAAGAAAPPDNAGGVRVYPLSVQIPAGEPAAAAAGTGDVASATGDVAADNLTLLGLLRDLRGNGTIGAPVEVLVAFDNGRGAIDPVTGALSTASSVFPITNPAYITVAWLPVTDARLAPFRSMSVTRGGFGLAGSNSVSGPVATAEEELYSGVAAITARRKVEDRSTLVKVVGGETESTARLAELPPLQPGTQVALDAVTVPRHGCTHMFGSPRLRAMVGAFFKRGGFHALLAALEAAAGQRVPTLALWNWAQPDVEASPEAAPGVWAGKALAPVPEAAIGTLADNVAGLTATLQVLAAMCPFLPSDVAAFTAPIVAKATLRSLALMNDAGLRELTLDAVKTLGIALMRFLHRGLGQPAAIRFGERATLDLAARLLCARSLPLRVLALRLLKAGHDAFIALHTYFLSEGELVGWIRSTRALERLYLGEAAALGDQAVTAPVIGPQLCPEVGTDLFYDPGPFGASQAPGTTALLALPEPLPAHPGLLQLTPDIIVSLLRRKHLAPHVLPMILAVSRCGDAEAAATAHEVLTRCKFDLDAETILLLVQSVAELPSSRLRRSDIDLVRELSSLAMHASVVAPSGVDALWSLLTKPDAPPRALLEHTEKCLGELLANTIALRASRPAFVVRALASVVADVAPLRMYRLIETVVGSYKGSAEDGLDAIAAGTGYNARGLWQHLEHHHDLFAAVVAELQRYKAAASAAFAAATAAAGGVPPGDDWAPTSGGAGESGAAAITYVAGITARLDFLLAALAGSTLQLPLALLEAVYASVYVGALVPAERRAALTLLGKLVALSRRLGVSAVEGALVAPGAVAAFFTAHVAYSEDATGAPAAAASGASSATGMPPVAWSEAAAARGDTRGLCRIEALTPSALAVYRSLCFEYNECTSYQLLRLSEDVAQTRVPVAELTGIGLFWEAALTAVDDDVARTAWRTLIGLHTSLTADFAVEATSLRGTGEPVPQAVAQVAAFVDRLVAELEACAQPNSAPLRRRRVLQGLTLALDHADVCGYGLYLRPHAAASRGKAIALRLTNGSATTPSFANWPVEASLKAFSGSTVWDLRVALAARVGVMPGAVGLSLAGRTLSDFDNGRTLGELSAGRTGEAHVIISSRCGCEGHRVPLLVDPSVRDYKNAVLTPPVRNALTTIFKRFAGVNGTYMTTDNVKSYYAACGTTITISTAADVIRRFEVGSMLLSLAGFLAFYAEASISRPDAVRNDLATHGFGEDAVDRSAPAAVAAAAGAGVAAGSPAGGVAPQPAETSDSPFAALRRTHTDLWRVLADTRLWFSQSPALYSALLAVADAGAGADSEAAWASLRRLPSDPSRLSALACGVGAVHRAAALPALWRSVLTTVGTEGTAAECPDLVLMELPAPAAPAGSPSPAADGTVPVLPPPEAPLSLQLYSLSLVEALAGLGNAPPTPSPPPPQAAAADASGVEGNGGEAGSTKATRQVALPGLLNAYFDAGAAGTGPTGPQSLALNLSYLAAQRFNDASPAAYVAELIPTMTTLFALPKRARDAAVAADAKTAGAWRLQFVLAGGFKRLLQLLGTTGAGGRTGESEFLLLSGAARLVHGFLGGSLSGEVGAGAGAAAASTEESGEAESAPQSKASELMLASVDLPALMGALQFILSRVVERATEAPGGGDTAAAASAAGGATVDADDGPLTEAVNSALLLWRASVMRNPDALAQSLRASADEALAGFSAAATSPVKPVGAATVPGAAGIGAAALVSSVLVPLLLNPKFPKVRQLVGEALVALAGCTLTPPPTTTATTAAATPAPNAAVATSLFALLLAQLPGVLAAPASKPSEFAKDFFAALVVLLRAAASVKAPAGAAGASTAAATAAASSKTPRRKPLDLPSEPLPPQLAALMPSLFSYLAQAITSRPATEPDAYAAARGRSYNPATVVLSLSSLSDTVATGAAKMGIASPSAFAAAVAAAEAAAVLASVQDHVLTGVLSLASLVTAALPDRGTAAVEAGGSLVRALISDCLFRAPSQEAVAAAASSSGDACVPAASLLDSCPKCLHPDTRAAAFLLVRHLVETLPSTIVAASAALAPILPAAAAGCECATPARSSASTVSSAASRAESGYVGLRNLGCICYMNAMIQQFFMTPAFRYGLLSVWDGRPIYTPAAGMAASGSGSGAAATPAGGDAAAGSAEAPASPAAGSADGAADGGAAAGASPAGGAAAAPPAPGVPVTPSGTLASEEASFDSMLYQLQRMFAHLLLSDRLDYTPTGWCHAFKDIDGRPTPVSVQQDASEFVTTLLDRVETALKGTPQADLVKRVYKGTTVYRKVCDRCKTISDMPQEFAMLTLDMSTSDIHSGLSGLTAVERLDGVDCDVCATKTLALRRQLLGTLPANLLVHFQRLCWDYETMLRQKINSKFEFPFVLDVTPYTVGAADAAAAAAATEGGAAAPAAGGASSPPASPGAGASGQYRLVGVLCHSGSAESGHYYSFICDRATGDWFEFNDSRVAPFSVADAPTRWFGGPRDGSDGTSRGGGANSAWYTDSSESAYMCVYERIDAAAAEPATLVAKALAGQAVTLPAPAGAAAVDAEAAATQPAPSQPEATDPFSASLLARLAAMGGAAVPSRRAADMLLPSLVPAPLYALVVGDNISAARDRAIFHPEFASFWADVFGALDKATRAGAPSDSGLSLTPADLPALATAFGAAFRYMFDGTSASEAAAAGLAALVKPLQALLSANKDAAAASPMRTALRLLVAKEALGYFGATPAAAAGAGVPSTRFSAVLFAREEKVREAAGSLVSAALLTVMCLPEEQAALAAAAVAGGLLPETFSSVSSTLTSAPTSWALATLDALIRCLPAAVLTHYTTLFEFFDMLGDLAEEQVTALVGLPQELAAAVGVSTAGGIPLDAACCLPLVQPITALLLPRYELAARIADGFLGDVSPFEGHLLTRMPAGLSPEPVSGTPSGAAASGSRTVAVGPGGKSLFASVPAPSSMRAPPWAPAIDLLACLVRGRDVDGFPLASAAPMLTTSASPFALPLLREAGTGTALPRPQPVPLTPDEEELLATPKLWTLCFTHNFSVEAMQLAARHLVRRNPHANPFFAGILSSGLTDATPDAVGAYASLLRALVTLEDSETGSPGSVLLSLQRVACLLGDPHAGTELGGVALGLPPLEPIPALETACNEARLDSLTSPERGLKCLDLGVSIPFTWLDALPFPPTAFSPDLPDRNAYLASIGIVPGSGALRPLLKALASDEAVRHVFKQLFGFGDPAPEAALLGGGSAAGAASSLAAVAPTLTTPQNVVDSDTAAGFTPAADASPLFTAYLWRLPPLDRGNDERLSDAFRRALLRFIFALKVSPDARITSADDARAVFRARALGLDYLDSKRSTLVKPLDRAIAALRRFIVIERKYLLGCASRPVTDFASLQTALASLRGMGRLASWQPPFPAVLPLPDGTFAPGYDACGFLRPGAELLGGIDPFLPPREALDAHAVAGEAGRLPAIGTAYRIRHEMSYCDADDPVQVYARYADRLDPEIIRAVRLGRVACDSPEGKGKPARIQVVEYYHPYGYGARDAAGVAAPLPPHTAYLPTAYAKTPYLADPEAYPYPATAVFGAPPRRRPAGWRHAAVTAFNGMVSDWGHFSVEVMPELADSVLADAPNAAPLPPGHPARTSEDLAFPNFSTTTNAACDVTLTLRSHCGGIVADLPCLVTSLPPHARANWSFSSLTAVASKLLEGTGCKFAGAAIYNAEMYLTAFGHAGGAQGKARREALNAAASAAAATAGVNAATGATPPRAPLYVPSAAAPATPASASSASSGDKNAKGLKLGAAAPPPIMTSLPPYADFGAQTGDASSVSGVTNGAHDSDDDSDDGFDDAGSATSAHGERRSGATVTFDDTVHDPRPGAGDFVWGSDADGVLGPLGPRRLSYADAPARSSAAADGGDWSCGACTYINKPTALACEMCDTPRS